ncbi:hypothetical protein KDL45_02975, partial [bacterium]|nr:hypothetical protein [bacterium]
DDAGNAVGGGEAEIVSTTFVNDATPLIRYRTEDRVILDDIECPCGRTHRTVAGVAGRNQDTLVGRNGEKISVAAINTHTDVYDGVLGFQYFQEKPGEAVVRIIPRGEISDDQKRRIVDEATFRTDHTVHFTIEQVDELQKTPRGKSLFIVRTFS